MQFLLEKNILKVLLMNELQIILKPIYTYILFETRYYISITNQNKLFLEKLL